MHPFSRLISKRLYVLLVALGIHAPVVHAGRPMAVDDAAIINPQGCELETWVQKNQSETQYWALPSCNISGNFELTLGSVRTVSDQDKQTAIVMQGKTVMKRLDTNGWGAGLVIGNQFDKDKSPAGDIYVNVPVSFSYMDDYFLVHVNSGWLHKRDSGRDLMTWGVGSELQVTERTGFTSEVYRQDVGKPYYQLGIRHQLIPNRLQIDASYGNRFNGGDNRFFSIGIVLSVDALIP
ncbi:hypothetical protein EV677_1687 [Herminiimonas fonticola]|uniref:Outer membrane beta-barrel porin/alpha-amylase n=2 Tax=Herminiimonas fonticola TaxID=303380 RepID=A0A4V6PRG5_9BURK|nr:hypothetical protein Hfont_2732 [Herminiimonas fonticola]TDN89628.1 hypothetical protein EV677_1687 [Herminiimonas fonticola]